MAMSPTLKRYLDERELRYERVEHELTRYGLATQAEVETIFADCLDGAAPAAGQAYGLPVILDGALLEAGELYFEAGDRRHLVRMNGGEFRRLMVGVPHERLSVHAARHASYRS